MAAAAVGTEGAAGAVSAVGVVSGPPHLALFDLDDTLVGGGTDALWCEFLMAEGLLARAQFGPRKAETARRYGEGSVTPREFCEF